MDYGDELRAQEVVGCGESLNAFLLYSANYRFRALPYLLENSKFYTLKYDGLPNPPERTKSLLESVRFL